MIDGIQNNIPRILFERGMTVKDLGEAAGIPYASIHAIVNNDKRGIMFHQLTAICKALNLGVGDIYEVAEES